MSKMALSTLINECKKYVWTNVYKLSKQSIKKNIQLAIVGYYIQRIQANLDLIVNRQKQTVK